MRKIFKVLSLMSLLFYTENGFSQSALVVGGGDVYLEGIGEMSATIGQIDFQYAESNEGSVTAGMQQSVFVLPNETTRTSKWMADELSIQVSPNPTPDVCRFTVVGGKSKTYSYNLTDYNGRNLFSGVAFNGAELDLSALSKGVYLLIVEVRGSKNSVVTFKIFKD